MSTIERLPVAEAEQAVPRTTRERIAAAKDLMILFGGVAVDAARIISYDPRHPVREIKAWWEISNRLDDDY